jgi:hypothetical protein
VISTGRKELKDKKRLLTKIDDINTHKSARANFLAFFFYCSCFVSFYIILIGHSRVLQTIFYGKKLLWAEKEKDKRGKNKLIRGNKAEIAQQHLMQHPSSASCSICYIQYMTI